MHQNDTYSKVKLFSCALVKLVSAVKTMPEMVSLTCCLLFAVLLSHIAAVSGQIGLGKSIYSSDPIIQYAAEVSLNMHPAQAALLKTTTSRIPGGYMIGAPEVVQLNMNLIRSINGTRALDVGLFTGFSALGAALAVAAGGEVVGMDITSHYWRQANSQQYFEQAGVMDKLTLRFQPASQTMTDLLNDGQSGRFDFCFIDADKSGYDNYYEQCLALLRPGGIISIDNALAGGRVATNGTKYGSVAVMDALNRKIGKDNRVNASLLTIADGLWVVFKK